jgi:hypothetical protein
MKTVECLSDTDASRADRPLSLVWQGHRYEIAEILARWRGPGEKGFRVTTMDGFAFELTYQEASDDWHVQPM